MNTLLSVKQAADRPGETTVGPEQLDLVIQRLDRIETALAALVRQRTVKEWYSTAEVAEQLGRAEYTVREWCRQGRVIASKRACGRGTAKEWAISHGELTRLHGHPASRRRQGTDQSDAQSAEVHCAASVRRATTGP